jgi:hypothetical protein
VQRLGMHVSDQRLQLRADSGSCPAEGIVIISAHVLNRHL